MPVLAEFVATQIKNPWIFFGVAGAIVAYLLYMMFRKRKGERPGFKDRELDL